MKNFKRIWTIGRLSKAKDSIQKSSNSIRSIWSSWAKMNLFESIWANLGKQSQAKSSWVILNQAETMLIKLGQVETSGKSIICLKLENLTNRTFILYRIITNRTFVLNLKLDLCTKLEKNTNTYLCTKKSKNRQICK